ncbi:hypothetical protein LshimejAT787_0902040 [Lyophyllum shimeji]|uniref:Uncharacterized protein n=1 Tax=Lyophyllum shimeji TaxID=47721 RepID=A0A9P3UMY2_LYOSH|nr:hypothetical protein LshimejAT787_0902040 [Lyophyllum shimeji]
MMTAQSLQTQTSTLLLEPLGRRTQRALAAHIKQGGSHSRPMDDEFAQVLKQVPYVFAGFLVESLLFGVHIVLFCICVYVLGTRRNPAKLIFLVLIVIMFGISLADIVLSYRFVLHDIAAVLKLKMSVVTAIGRAMPKGYLYVSNNLFADALLIYRCYKVWDSRKYIMLVAGAVLVADSVWGYLSMNNGTLLSVSITFTPVFYWSVFAFNIVITLATAGRIWWVARAARPILERRQIQQYNTAIAIIVESGAIYSLCVLLMAAIPSAKSYRVIFLAISIRVVCIMPTLMIVQVELGRNATSESRLRPECSLPAWNRFSTLPPSSVTDSKLDSAILPSVHCRPKHNSELCNIVTQGSIVLGGNPGNLRLTASMYVSPVTPVIYTIPWLGLSKITRAVPWPVRTLPALSHVTDVGSKYGIHSCRCASPSHLEKQDPRRDGN